MADFLRFHVRLLEVQRPLWRRFLLAEDANFSDLHLAIQDACGWENCHLFAFWTPDTDEPIAGIPDPDWESETPDAAETSLLSYFNPERPTTCIYQYDFGDDWRHEVALKGVETHRVSFHRRLLEGEGTFPPEDCGSTWGYERCVAAVSGEWNADYGGEEERRHLLEWLDGWTPEQFSLKALKKGFNE